MTLLIGFAAVNTGNNLLFFIVAGQLGFMAVSGMLGWLNIRRITPRFDFSDEIYSGTDTLVNIGLRNRRNFLPSFLIKVHAFGRTADFPIVEKGTRSSAQMFVRFDGRGRKSAAGSRISSMFPVNFFIRYAPARQAETFIVFPQPRPAVSTFSSGKGREGTVETVVRGYEGDVAKIGDYTGTEPQKLIHWRLSAKHEQFKVKQMTALVAEPVILDPAEMPGRDLEERLSHASWLVNRLIRERRPVGLKVGEKVIAPAAGRAHRLLLLRELALYDQD